MKKVEIIPRKLGGTITIPPSKSVSHRAVMCAALAEGESRITNILLSDDITATCEAMAALGASIDYNKQNDGTYILIIRGTSEMNAKNITVDCIESGSTLRFIVPLMALHADNACVTGRARLVKRPMGPYYKIFDEQNINYTKEIEGQELPLHFSGELNSGTYCLDGSISSQFITGLLFALPLLEGDSEIVITTPLESKPYIDITLDVMKQFGIAIKHDNYERFWIKGGQKYKASDYRVEGDFSQGAFWLVGGILGKGILCEDLSPQSCQGDNAIVEIIRAMKGDVQQKENAYYAKPSVTEGTVIDVSQCPDLVPILTVLAAASSGRTDIIGAARLRFKESDRLAAMNDVLSTMGARIEEHPDSLTIHGTGTLSGGTVSSHNDHRIAMAAAIASFICQEKVTITDSECVKKSYPDFWQDFKKMGGDILEFDMGK